MIASDGGFYAKAVRDQKIVFPLIKEPNHLISSHISWSSDDYILKNLKEDILSPTFGKEENKQEEKYTLTSNLKFVLKNASAKIPSKKKPK